MNVQRIPLFVADVEIHNLILLKIRVLLPETSWGAGPHTDVLGDAPPFKGLFPCHQNFLEQNVKKILTLKQ